MNIQSLISPHNKLHMMKHIRYLILMLFTGFITSQVNAQATCSFTVDYTRICEGGAVKFTSQTSGGGSVKGFKWDFGNGNNNNQNNSSLDYIYTKSGTFTPQLTIYFSNGDSCVTASSIVINVFPKPIVKYILAPNYKDTQCYEGNLFCLIDSSKPDTVYKSPITRRVILWDDGSIDTTKGSWPGGTIICHSYTDPRQQSYTPRLVISDSNGCVVNFEIKNYLTVRGKIGPAFSTSYSLKCDSTDVTFTNTTNIPTNEIEYFEWDFGDGTFYKSSTPPSQADLAKYWNNFVHWYKTQGPFAGKLKVKSKYGCWDSVELAKAGDNVNLELDATVEEDTMCAAGNILYFHNKTLFYPQPGVAQVYWIWNHPPPNAIDSGSWNPSHSFPGCKYPTNGEVYVIARTWNPPCIKTDTVKFIKLYGPSAAIESPPSGIMIADTERHQCDVRDTVHFTNASDTCDGLYRLEWYWDFDDASNIHSLNDTAYLNYKGMYGPKNDTIIGGKQVLKNTNFSREWKPVHMYDSTEANERCHTPKLIMDGWFLKWDTLLNFMDTIHCQSMNQVPLSLMNPSAKGLEVLNRQCLGPMPPYGITFKWDKTKPGCTQQYVSICFDSACCAFTPTKKYNDPACWSEQSTFNIPPWSPFPPWPTQYKRPYFFTCDDSTGWVTVGLVIHNRRNETDSNVQIGKYKRCSDTVWYHRKLRFVNLDPNFGSIMMDDTPYYVCPRTDVTFQVKKPYQDSIISITWNWGDLTRTTDSIWRRPYKRKQYEYDSFNNVKITDLTTLYGDTDMISPRHHVYAKRGRYTVSVSMMNTDSCQAPDKRKRVLIGNSAYVYLDPVYNCITGATVTFQHVLNYWDKLGIPYDIDTANYWDNPTIHPYSGLSRAKPPGGYETATWFFDDNVNPTANGNGSGNIVTHTYKRMGTYHPYLVFKDSMGCRDTIVNEVFVDSLNANFGMDKPVVACDQLVSFYDSSAVFGPCVQNNPNCTDRITDWLWDFGDGKVSSILQNPVHQYLYPGTYYVKLIVKSQIGCYDTIVKPVRVKGPAPKFIVDGDTAGCAPFTPKFKNLSDSVCEKYTWKWGDNTTSTDTTDSLTHTYLNEGVYDIYLTASGNVYDSIIGKPLTCSFTYPDTAHPIRIYVRNTPPVAINIPKRICVNEKFPVMLAPDSIYEKHYVYYGDSTQDTGIVVKNRFKNGIDTLFHSYSKVGTYVITYTPKYTPQPWCFATKTDSIVVTDVTANFDIDSLDVPMFKFTNTSSSNAVKWWWDFGHPSSSSNTATTKDASHDYGNDKGTFDVKLIVQSSDGCYDTIIKKVTNDYEIIVKIPNLFTPDGDGNNDEYYVKTKGLSKEEDNYRLYIYNQWGEKVFESQDTAVKWNGKVNNTGADCPTGTYFYNFYYKLRAWVPPLKDKDYGEQTEVIQLEKDKPYGFAKGTITLLRKE
jgi:gliding motility-associated-like protein